MQRFEGKVVLITGAASGIGGATVLRMAREGASLFCVDVHAEGVQKSAKGAVELGAEAEAHVCDVGDPAQVEATVKACVDRFGRLDSLVPTSCSCQLWPPPLSRSSSARTAARRPVAERTRCSVCVSSTCSSVPGIRSFSNATSCH